MTQNEAGTIMARALMQMLPADRELAFEERMKIGGVTVDDVFPDLPVTMRLFAGKLFAQVMTAVVNHMLSRPVGGHQKTSNRREERPRPCFLIKIWKFNRENPQPKTLEI